MEEAARKERMRKVMDYRAELSARPPMQPSFHTTYVAEEGRRKEGAETFRCRKLP